MNTPQAMQSQLSAPNPSIARIASVLGSNFVPAKWKRNRFHAKDLREKSGLQKSNTAPQRKQTLSDLSWADH